MHKINCITFKIHISEIQSSDEECNLEDVKNVIPEILEAEQGPEIFGDSRQAVDDTPRVPPKKETVKRKCF